jgi:hypothetical protein
VTLNGKLYSVHCLSLEKYFNIFTKEKCFMIIYLDMYGVWNEVYKDCIEKVRRAFPVDWFLQLNKSSLLTTSSFCFIIKDIFETWFEMPALMPPSPVYSRHIWSKRVSLCPPYFNFALIYVINLSHKSHIWVSPTAGHPHHTFLVFSPFQKIY